MAVKLSTRMDEVKQARDDELVLDAWARPRLDDDLVWSTRPLLHRSFRSPTSPTGLSHTASAHVGAIVGARPGPDVVQVAEAAFFLDTSNQQRTLEPVVAACADEAGTPASTFEVDVSRRALLSRSARALRLARDVHGWMGSRGRSVDLSNISDQFLGAARALARAETILGSGHFSTIVVSSQHNANARALLCIAQRNGIRTVYVPHTAGSRLREYRDLPCDVALLRGEGDRSFYRGIGAREHGLLVSGNPSVETHPATSVDPGLGPVLALSPDPPDVLEELIAVSADAWPTGIIAPHPRSDRGELERLLPAGWKINAGRTFDLLEKGPFAVIQHSSGVGWEALSLGLPVVQLDFPGKPADYLFLEDPAIERVTSSPELRVVLERALTDHDDDRARDTRRALAAWWCASSGAESAAHMATAIHQPPPPRTGEVLLDGWRTGIAVAE